MLSATVSHYFSAGHRIIGGIGTGAKCGNVHGHTFKVEWTVQLDDNADGSVDLATVTALLRGWVDGHLDHAFILDVDDSVLANTLADWNSKTFYIQGRPTVAAITWVIAKQSQEILRDLRILEVRLTENGTAVTWTYDWQGAVEDTVEAKAARGEYGLPGFNPYKGLVESEPNVDLVTRNRPPDADGLPEQTGPATEPADADGLPE